MRIRVDRKSCCGAGNCAMAAPEVFDQDERDGLVVVLRPSPSPEQTPLAVRAADLCPAHAIRIEGG